MNIYLSSQGTIFLDFDMQTSEKEDERSQGKETEKNLSKYEI